MRAIRIGYTNFAPDDELRLINMVNGKHPQPGDKENWQACGNVPGGFQDGSRDRSRREAGPRTATMKQVTIKDRWYNVDLISGLA